MEAALALLADDTFGLEGRVVKTPKELTKDDMLILWGGEDISPSIYKERVYRAHAGDTPSARDKAEIKLATRALELGIPILGICRGAQLMCCLLGGKLWQHVDNHGHGEHSLIFEDKEYVTNSCHHQMMVPTDDMDILGYTPALSPRKCGDFTVVMDEGDEPEIVVHKAAKTVMIQGHPEWVSVDHDLYKITQTLIKRLYENRL